MALTDARILTYTIATSTVEGKIEIALMHEFEGIQQRMFSSIIDTQELALREALVKLGWTPPAKNTHPCWPKCLRTEAIGHGCKEGTCAYYDYAGNPKAADPTCETAEEAAATLDGISSGMFGGNALAYARAALRWALLRIAVLQTPPTVAQALRDVAAAHERFVQSTTKGEGTVR